MAETYAGLRLEAVVKEFGARRHPHRALDGVSMDLARGEAVGIVGESGSGKSTLAKIVVGLERASSGNVLYNGESVPQLLSTPGGRAEFRRAVQFVSQDTTTSFDPLRSLRESVRLPVQRLRGLSAVEADRVVDATLESLGIDPRSADRRPVGVSGGQRQRFAIARALVVQPSLLVCDEVVSALDVSVQGSILNLLKEHCERGGSLVFVSHGLPATAFVSDRLAVMYGGRVIETGTPRDVVGSPQHEYTRRLLSAFRGGGAPAGPPVTSTARE